MMDLKRKRCLPCEGGVQPLQEKDLAPFLSQVPHWILVEGMRIEREIECKDFRQALYLLNHIGQLAEEEEGHHPDIFLHSWNKVKLILFTHAINGLSENDFIVATKIDELIEKDL